MSIEHLPSELLGILSKFCTTKDLKNLACCSSGCSSLLRPILWQSVFLDLKTLVEDESLPFEYLEHTSKFHLDQVSYENTNMVEAAAEKLAKVFNFCNPYKVNELILNRQLDTTLIHALSVFPLVETLDIQFLESHNGWDWQDLPDMKKLRSLTAVDIFIELDLMLKRSQLRSLTLTSFASDNYPINLIAEEKQLEKLCVNFGYRNFEVDLMPLAQLKNLKYLELFGMEGYSEESLLHLCRHLFGLVTLVFQNTLQLRCSSLQELKQLRSLRHLTLDTPEHMLTSECLVHVSMIPQLRTLTFHASMCNDEWAFERAGLLNRVLTLHHVFMHICLESSAVVNDLIAGLVHDKTWKLRYTRHYDEATSPTHHEGCAGYYSFSSMEF